MRYLFSVAPELVAEDEQGLWAPAGEPVVPWYPATLVNAFIAVPSFKRSLYAENLDSNDFDPDKVVQQLAEYYPGLPLHLHTQYVLAIGLAANKFNLHTKFRIMITPDMATLCVVNTDVAHILWTKQPL